MSKQRENNRDDHIDPPRTIPLFERIFKVDRDKIYRKHLLAMFKQGQGTNNLSIVSCESGAETMPAQTAFDKVLSNYCSPVKYHRSQELPNDFPERGAAVKRSGSNSVRRSKRGGGMEREKKNTRGPWFKELNWICQAIRNGRESRSIFFVAFLVILLYLLTPVLVSRMKQRISSENFAKDRGN